MTIDRMTNEDFERAYNKAFWRKVLRRLTGENNALLPFDSVREQMPLKGQHFVGLQQVPIDQIVGSMGRYRDFDRAFLPLQKRTKSRWISIDRAHYEEVELPPVELYKMGEVYFVKDGNHRVSVARERGQLYLDAFVTEIEVPVLLTADLELSDLGLKIEYALFLDQTNLTKIRPQASLELTLPGEYDRILEHISVHRWYLGEQKKSEVPYSEAVASWYDNVYSPLIELIEQDGLPEKFPNRTAADLYLWIIEYLWYLREAYREEFDFGEAAHQFIQNFSEWPASKLVNLLKRASWVDHLILKQEKDNFYSKTRIQEVCAGVSIDLTMPGLYEKLGQHIDVHRWYLGLQLKKEVPFNEAVQSWCTNVYLPLVELIREQAILDEFPGRTESDLYLWIIEHQGFLREEYGDVVTLEAAAEHFAEDYSPEGQEKSADQRQDGKKKDPG
ncbi:MAG TPA: hypothetical protein VI776_12745 [Anaerolineales bacterium]|nr:hypothetical protein [Anaerolineales bacterium]